MELSVSVGITCLLMILCALSDYFLGTRYMGNTYFQPFPHLLIFGFCFLDLVLWYKKRKKKRKKSVPPQKRNIFDNVLLWIIFVYSISVVYMIVEYMIK